MYQMLPFLGIIIVTLWELQIFSVFGFNVDSINYIRHEGQPDSMFGFSVALHKEAERSWVIIGAPKADTSSLQRDVYRGGAVYRCDISEDNRCQLIPFDSQGNQHNDRGEQIDTKSNQWFGATVASAGINGPLVACAPRYVFHMMQPRKVERNEPVGTCFMVKNNFRDYTEYSPCRTSYWGYHRQGSCQAGLSASLTKDGERLFIGAPGSWYWQGQIYSINTDATFQYKPPLYSHFGEGGQLYAYDLNNPKHKVYSTGESASTEDDSYLGYSTTVGDFNGNGTEGVAVGMPRGAGLLGKVLIFSWNVVNQDNITGEQIGAYFGYSLCSVDVDGDKLDDLIIGAPMYTEPNNEGKYEMGRIYIMFQGRENKFKTLETRDGTNSKARFGLALTSLGDINLDGYGDFAVGAPYDGPLGNGAVHIFHGSPNGPLAKASQIIYAEDVVGTYDLKTFGFSLSGGIDLDGNMYPDIVVGAYESNKAIVFKSRPVAVMEASTIFETESKLISLDEKNCSTIRDRKQVTCTSIKSCLKYNGINLPTFVDIDVSWVLDSKKTKSPRMFFLSDEGKSIRNSTMRLYRGKTECRSERVYLIENIRDKLTPIEVEMKYQLRPSTLQTTTPVRRRRGILEPVIDQNRGTIQRDSINIQKNCGPDNICIPDLRLDIKSVDKYLLGSKDLLIVEVLVSNFGEDAFEAGFYMMMPEDLNFKKIERIGDLRDTPVTCTAPSIATNHTLKCDIGNPLAAGKIANFKVIMIPSQKSGMAPSYDFYMEANSTNAEAQGSGFDNVIRKNIGIWIETDLSIEGTSIPDYLHYNSSEYKHLENATKEHDIGPQVVHMYNIRNNGPSTIEESEVFILWPYETMEGDSLMYLLNQPETSGNIKCDPTVYANERDVLLDTILSRKSYLESSGAIARASGWSRDRHGVHIEHSTFTTPPTILTNDNKRISKEEERKLVAEENMESTGDASFIHSQRANAAAASRWNTYGSGTANRAQSQPFSWDISSETRAQPNLYTSNRNRSMHYNAQGRPYYIESSTEHYGVPVHSASFFREQHNTSHNIPTHTNSQYLQANQRVAVSSHENNRNYYNKQRQNQNNAGQTWNIRENQHHKNVLSNEMNLVRNQPQHVSPTTVTYNHREYETSTGRRRMMSQQDSEPFSPNLISGVSGLEKAAQGGQGFQAGIFDLEVLQRQNTDNVITQRVAGSQLIDDDLSREKAKSNRYHQSQSSFSFSTRSGIEPQRNVQKHSTSHLLGTDDTKDYQEYDQEYYDDDEDNIDDDLETGLPSPISHDGNGIDRRRLSKSSIRSKRDTYQEEDTQLDKALRCNSIRCAVLRCTAGPLSNDEGTWIAIRTRLVAKTMKKLASNVPLNISTMAVARVSKLPYIGSPKDKQIKNHEITLTAIPEPIVKPDVVPLWVVVLSACAGTIILLLLVFLLYKCGFFNRNRPSDSSERQPLNRNGNYHGDEHL